MMDIITYSKTAKIENTLKSVVPAVYTVGSGKDFSTFTAMLTALQNDDSKKVVYVDSGVYDIFEEMGGAEYMAEISATASQLNWRDVCKVVPPNTKIVGLGNVVLKWEATAAQMVNSATAFLFSPLNLSGSCEIENIKVIGENCRYAVHDETSGLAEFDGAKHYFKDCVFTYLSSSYGNSPYVAGHNKLMEVVFDNCVFDSRNSNMIWSTHDNSTPLNDNSVFIFNNCVFTSTKADPYVRFVSGDTYGRKDIVKFNNCFLKKIKFTSLSGSDVKQGYDVTLVGSTFISVEHDAHITDKYAVNQYNAFTYKACTGISLNKQTTKLTTIGATETLVATVTPADTTENVAWESSDTSILTVNSEGTITAVGVGTVTLTATCGSYSASCSVEIEVAFSGVNMYPDAYISVNTTYSGNSGLVVYSAGGTKYGLMCAASGDTAAFKAGGVLYYPFKLPIGTKRIRITYSSNRVYVNRAIFMSQAETAPGKTYAQAIDYATNIPISDNVSIVNIPSYDGFPEVDSILFWLFTSDNSTFLETDFATLTIEAIGAA